MSKAMNEIKNKIVGAWELNYIDTNLKSMMLIHPHDTFGCGEYLGHYEMDEFDRHCVTFKFKSVQLPGLSQDLPLTLEANFNIDYTCFSGSIYNRAYPDGSLRINAKVAKDAPEHHKTREDLVVGEWQIEYQNTPTNTEISFYKNHTFYQRDGKYRGKWNLENSLLTLEFDTLTFKDGKKIILNARLNGSHNFDGVIENELYNRGHYHGNDGKLLFTAQKFTVAKEQSIII